MTYWITLWFGILLYWYLFNQIQVIKKQNRLKNAFIAGMIRSISNYRSWTDIHEESDDIPVVNKKLPISYDHILDSIVYELQKDYSVWEIIAWLETDRWLFNEKNSRWDGFVFIYYDLYEKIEKRFDLANISKDDLKLMKAL